jgi:hypothetical protein
MRWAQNNNSRFEGRLWQDKTHWAQAAAFWWVALREHRSKGSSTIPQFTHFLFRLSNDTVCAYFAKAPRLGVI